LKKRLSPNNLSDTFKSIIAPSPEVLFKEKNSKFFGYAFPVSSEEDVMNHLKQLRKAHQSAGHFCYAYQLGTEHVVFRANDDGEPSNAAGMPIFGQLQSYGLTNILVVVVRYFGGVKLGVGGLMLAYKTTAQLALDSAEIIEETIKVHFNLRFSYAMMGKIMRIVKEKNIQVQGQQMELLCLMQIAVRKRDAVAVQDQFRGFFGVVIDQI